MWIEVKKPGETPRKLQGYKLDRWRRAGAVAISVTSCRDAVAALYHLRIFEDWERFYAEDEAGRRMRGKVA